MIFDGIKKQGGLKLKGVTKKYIISNNVEFVNAYELVSVVNGQLDNVANNNFVIALQYGTKGQEIEVIDPLGA